MDVKTLDRGFQLHRQINNLREMLEWIDVEKDKGRDREHRYGDLLQLPADITESARLKCYAIAAQDLHEQLEQKRREFDNL